jgi:hypothetical protein
MLPVSGQFLLAQTPSIPAPQPIRYHIADCHLHLVDFFQKGDGARGLLQAMDRAGVEQAMVSGMPLVKKWDAADPVGPLHHLDSDAPCYWYSATDVLVAREVQALPPADRERLVPFICGFNCTDRNAVDHVKRMIEWYPGFWKGIGEVITRHDEVTHLTPGETARADHVALGPMYELAADLGLPVVVHSNVGAARRRGLTYLHEIENALKAHPRTRLVWAHAGLSHDVDAAGLPREVRRLLSTYPNLTIDLSWVVFDQLVKDSKPVLEWVQLIEAFPERFVLGSDIVAKFAAYHVKIQRYYVLLDALKSETARRVARENFLALLPRRGAVLKAPLEEGAGR